MNKFADSAPAAKKSLDYIKSKTEYTPRLDLISEEIKAALQNGNAEMIPCKDASEVFYLQIRTTVKGLVINGKEYGKNRKIKDIPIGSKAIPADVSGAMQCLSMQNQLNQISNSLKEISEQVLSLHDPQKGSETSHLMLLLIYQLLLQIYTGYRSYHDTE